MYHASSATVPWSVSRLFFCPGALHSRSMCSMDSSSLQTGHVALCSNPGMLFQNFPHLCALCIDFHRNSLIFLVMSLFLIDFQMALSVGNLSLRSLIAHLARSRFTIVPILSCNFFCCSIPMYRLA